MDSSAVFADSDFGCGLGVELEIADVLEVLVGVAEVALEVALAHSGCLESFPIFGFDELMDLNCTLASREVEFVRNTLLIGSLAAV
jgi:hypothetical protein